MSSVGVELLRAWRGNVAKFAWDNFKFEADPPQRKLFDAFPSQDPDKMRIALRACAGPGKTAGLAVCGWNALACYGGRGIGNFKGAAVSISGDNLRDNLWAEFAKWQDRSEFLKREFTWTKRRIFAKGNPEGRFISARSWAKSASEDQQAQALSGLHGEFVLVLVDESGDIPIAILRKADQALSNVKWGKILQAGNPTSHDGMLYAAATDLAHQWLNIPITGDPDDPNRSPRVDAKWAREQIETHGRSNPWVMSYVLGEFPAAALNTLLSPEDVEAAMKRALTIGDYGWAQKRVGIDVARFGDDASTICPRQGLAHFMPVLLRGANSHEVAGRVAVGHKRWGAELHFLDETGGYGSGVHDALNLAKITVYPVNFSSSSPGKGFFNMRAFIHWQFAQAIKGGAMLPNIPQLKRELVTPRYWFEKGKIRLEDKDQIKARLKFSPDISDGYATTYALPDMPALPDDPIAATLLQREMNRTKDGGVHDPFKEPR